MKEGTQRYASYGIAIIVSAWIIYFFNVGFPLYGASAINACMMEQTGFSEVVIGTAVGGVTLMQGLCAPFLGTIVGRRGIRFPLVIGSVLLVVGGGVLTCGPTAPGLFLMVYVLLIGGGMGLAGILTVQCVVNEWFDGKNKSQILTAVLISGNVAGVILPQISQSVSAVRWQLGWAAMTGACLISLLLSVFVIRNHPEDSANPLPERQSAEETGGEKKPVARFANKTFYIGLLNNSLRLALYYTYIGHVVLYIVGQGLPREYGITAISIVSAVGLLGRLLSGFLFSKVLPSSRSCAMANVLCATSALILLLGSSKGIFYCSAALMGAGLGVGHISFPMFLSEHFGKALFPRVSGASGAFSYIISAFGPMIAGVCATALGSYKPIFGVLLSLCFFGGLAMLFGLRREE